MASDDFDRRDDEFDDRDRGDDRRTGRADPRVGREKVKAPGTALLAYGLFSFVLGVVSLAVYLAAPDAIAKPYHDMLKDLTKDAPKQPGQPDPVPPYDEFKPQMVTQGAIGAGLASVFSLVTLFGGVKMRNARGYGLSMVGAVLAMVPCTTACCILGLPIGIWAVVVLAKPEVKAAFQSAA